MSKDTRIHLVQDLRAILPLAENVAHVPALNFIIAEAQAGEYHDFKNTKYPCGKIASNERLTMVGTPSAIALAERIREGEYDEAPDDDDRREIMKIWQDARQGRV